VRVTESHGASKPVGNAGMYPLSATMRPRASAKTLFVDATRTMPKLSMRGFTSESIISSQRSVTLAAALIPHPSADLDER
jgi:hypothetical protein